MNALTWIKLFATFAQVAADVVDAFVEKHPELRDPPPVDKEEELHDEFLDEVAKKFPRDDPYEPEA